MAKRRKQNDPASKKRVTFREHYYAKLPICHQCMHWGKDKDNRIGCLLFLPRCPRRIHDWLLAGRGCKCSKSPRFGPAPR